ISVCDITRPMPSRTVLPVLLRDLSHISDQNIMILVATGTHRSNTDSELRQMLGDEIVDRYNVLNHNAFDDTILKSAGETQDGIPIFLNRHWLESDLRITVGFVEPHFFAGFSGGPKMVAPGLAGFDTIMRLHNAEMIGHPEARWGVTVGNPIHDSIREIAAKTGVDFALDVTINRERRITSVYAGEPTTVHHTSCRFARTISMQPVNRPFEVVLTTNSGYPLDQNLYQAVKGMSAAAQVVKRGGSIIAAAECLDGIPDHGEYGRLLRASSGPQDILNTVHSPGHNVHDQWQVQIQAQIQLKANVKLKSTYLTEEQVRIAHIEPIEDVEMAVDEELMRHGSGSRLCVIPEGPQTIPYLVAN
ncbi:MAG: nickel-dependent lactate racemase, partial [Dehalococcoidia bacterium]|nr:nickel-dependent lactate racemase [Dehalococcoidia bacterium]